MVVGATTVPLAESAAAGENFGRLHSPSRTCSSNLSGSAPAPCHAVQFDQQLEGLLNIRFISSRGSGDGRDQLTFVGTLSAESTPLSCRQGRCRLQGPVQTTVTSISETGFDERGVPIGLPKAWPSKGQCSVQQRQVRCEGKALSGETWRANAEF
jgi:hypothetical protein